ncbi:hypothetical protein MIMGU_mgv1a022274mg [Erythranthe guttata]|uniref:Uncharacterized protein n=1 Tax=Erythranthe guttata TaxID=4155 RepID=A0A022RAP9_ERYGU|nr:hypothetical protein MIMGU_mgv1a022274mg [Erythranthe guttata]
MNQNSTLSFLISILIESRRRLATGLRAEAGADRWRGGLLVLRRKARPMFVIPQAIEVNLCSRNNREFLIFIRQISHFVVRRHSGTHILREFPITVSLQF